MRPTICCLFLAMALTCASARSLAEEERVAEQETARQTPLWKAFEWSELTRQLEESGSPWLSFLRVPTLDVGVYALAAGATDRQPPHERDEVYYIVQGKAVLRVEGEDQPVQSGTVVFVAAQAKHHFHSISQDLQVLVFFSLADPEASQK